METDNNKIQISGAVLNRNVSLDIKNQLKNIKGLSVSVEQIAFKTSSITNAKKMLASKPVSLQVELDTFALKQQAQMCIRDRGYVG